MKYIVTYIEQVIWTKKCHWAGNWGEVLNDCFPWVKTMQSHELFAEDLRSCLA
jgi:hypothetical protein